jgi:hypothetical protein
MCRRSIAIDSIDPLHKPHAEDRLGNFTNAMLNGGWGRLLPLVVVEQCGRFRALTGAHRYAAAKKAELKEIPCLVISALQWKAAGLRYEEVQTLSDQERAEKLCAAGLRSFAEEIERQNPQIANGSQRGFCSMAAARKKLH